MQLPLMTYKVQKVEDAKVVVFKLSGRIQKENVTELSRLCEAIEEGRELVLDLEEVKLVDQDVVRFLERWEGNGARLQNCPAYIRHWIAQQQERTN
jgi:hypothetical protein